MSLALGALVASACGESERQHPDGSGNRAARAGSSQAGSAALGGSAGRSTGGGGGSGAGLSGDGGDGGETQVSGGSPSGGSSSGGRSTGGRANHAGEQPTAGEGGAGSSGGGQAGAGNGGSNQLNCLADPDPTPMLPSSVELDADAVARAAVVLGSCVPDDGADRNAAALWRGSLAAPRIFYRYAMQLDCLAHAQCGCAALERCIGLSLSESTACAPHCESDVYVTCGGDFDLPDTYDYRLDCGRFGMTCDPDAICSDGPALACDTSTSYTCTGDDRQQACEDGFLQRSPACGTVGLTCADGFCTGAGAACINVDPPSFGQGAISYEGVGCSGSSLEACANGHATTIDCSARGPGFSCQEFDDQFFCGLASECVPAPVGQRSPSHPPSCDGSVLTFCNAGRLEHVDCTSLGFTGCEIAPSAGRYGCTPSLTDE